MNDLSNGLYPGQPKNEGGNAAIKTTGVTP